MQWVDAKTNPPTERGEYLCVKSGSYGHRHCDILRYAKNLEVVDNLDFHGKRRPGWYYYDHEYGYLEQYGVTHWMPLPELPEEFKLK